MKSLPDPHIPDDRTPGPARRILLVEDSKPVAAVFAAILEELGHAVDVVHSGADALRRLAATPPEIVISDVSMPGMDGHELARTIRKGASDNRPILVALSAYSGPEYRTRALEAGFDHYLEKPADYAALEALFAAIDRRGPE